VSVSALDRAKRAWASDYAGLAQEEVDVRVRAFTAMVRAIFAEGVLTPDRFAELMEFDSATAKELFAGLSAIGMQVDAAGNIVGAALTTQETAHKMRIGGKKLFAWCALDTLFLPGLLGTSAEVASVCPKSGESIRLSVSPERIESCEPPDAWLSVFLPGSSSAQTGPASPT